MAFAAKGSPAMAVAAFAGPPRSISAIVLHNSSIQSVADLKGKMIAVSTTGSLSDWLAKQMAIQEGWGQDGIRAVPLGAIPASIAALKSKQIDAVVLATEAGYRLEEQKEGHVLAHDGSLCAEFHHSCGVGAENAHRQESRPGDALPSRLFRHNRVREGPQGRDVTPAERVLLDDPQLWLVGFMTLRPGCLAMAGGFDPRAVVT